MALDFDIAVMVRGVKEEAAALARSRRGERSTGDGEAMTTIDAEKLTGPIGA